MEIRTLNQLLARAFEERPRDRALLHKQDGEWKAVSTAEWMDAAQAAALGLEMRGVRKGDRVALLAENRVEWFLIEAGLQILGAVTVPIYPTLTAAQAAYIIENSGALAVIVSTAEQQEKIVQARDRLPEVKHVFTLDPPIAALDSEPWSAVVAAGREMRKTDTAAADRLAAAVGPDDVATFIYTSGTTGNPKGVMLTQANLVQNTLASRKAIALRDNDIAISVLPYSHVFARMVDHYLFPHAGVTIAIAENMDSLVANIGEVKPTLLPCVPRFYEKMRDRVQESAAAGSPLKRRIFDWAFRVGHEMGGCRQKGEKPGRGLRMRYGLATRLVFSKLHARLGGRMRLFISGGAALPRDVAEFFLAAGWLVLEGYGLTETSPVITVNRVDAFCFGSVGLPIEGVEVRIASDGEILCRGHNVMKGYYGNEEATAEAVQDGWFHTGDIGVIDDGGFLRITDRKKDILVTSGGKNVPPQPIEGQLKASPYIAEAVLVGDGKPFIAALVTPEFEEVRRYCEEKGAPVEDLDAMAASSLVAELLRSEVDRLGGDRARYEQIRKIAVLPAVFSIEGGELTPTLKVRRRAVLERYADQVAELYATT